MDVVRTDIERIGGSVDLVSQLGLGTTCRVQVPLTLAIIPALLVGESSETYAIPQINLVELIRLEGEDRARAVQVIGGAAVLRLRGHLLPLLVLAEVLEVRPAPSDATTVIVLQANGVRFGLVVAEVHDTQEIVVKPLGRQLRGLATYAGATILGDGQVSLILDVAGLARLHAIDTLAPAQTEPDVVPADLTELLVVQAAPGRRAALPMAHISRLEEIPVSTVERSGEREVVQYRDAILPLLRLAPVLGLPPASPGRTHLAVAVRDDGTHQVGIVVDQVLDAVEIVVVCSDVGRRHGVLGSMVVQGHVTELIDLDVLVAAVMPDVVSG